MKEYDREKRKYVEKTTGQGKFKSRETCRGRKPHDYILTLPEYVKVTDDIVPEAITEYYASEIRRREFENAEDEKLRKLGLKIWGKSHWHSMMKRYRCTVCDKREYKDT